MCTNIVLSASQCSDSRLSARSMDYAGNAGLKFSVRYMPVKQSFPSFPPSQNPFKWTNDLAFVGVIAVDKVAIPYFYDGLNTAGLSAACLNLPESVFPQPSESTPNLHIGDLVGWALGTCSTVDDVYTGLTKSFTVIAQKLGTPLALHVVFTDSTGAVLVVEFVNGVMQIYPSKTTLPPGPVLTNAPTLDWHLANLPNYANLGVVNVPQSFFGQQLNGSGLRGLPGDGTPPSRFVRASTMLETMYRPQNVQQSVGLALQLIEACATPYGTIATMVKEVETISECTQWITIRDHQNLVYYYSSAFNPVLSRIELKSLTGDKVQTLAMGSGAWYEDVTSSFVAAAAPPET